MRKYLKFLAAGLAAITVQANAAYIELNSTQKVGVLEIDSSVASFDDFYAYDGSEGVWSTTLPFAQSNTAVFFLASLNNQLALFGLFDDYDSTGNSKGEATFDYVANKGTVAMDHVENEAGDVVNGSQTTFKWGKQNGDGFILDILTPDYFDLSASLSALTGLGGGKVFLSFNGDGTYDEIDLTNRFNVTYVPAPATFGLFLLAGVAGLVLRRRS